MPEVEATAKIVAGDLSRHLSSRYRAHCFGFCSRFVPQCSPPPLPAVESTLHELRATVRANALNRPGVYRMVGRGGIVIYVGKSKRVRTRLLGYFRAAGEEKAWRIIRDAQRIEWEYVPSEFASLLKELELIKQHRPPYNVRQKRDGNYAFLKLSAGLAPRLHVVRRVAGGPGVYFGPFRGGSRISEAVKELNDVLLLRDCRTSIPIRFADQSDLFGLTRTPLCPRHELMRCSAPCAGGCSAAEYAGRIRQARAFLEGDADGPVRQLEARMAAAAERWEYEHAASLRTRIGRLESLREEFARLREVIEGLTFLYAVPGTEKEHRVYAVRRGSIRAVFVAPRTARERKALLRSAEEHYQRPESTSAVTTPHRIDELLLVGHWFRTRPQERRRTYPPDRWGDLPLADRLE